MYWIGQAMHVKVKYIKWNLLVKKGVASLRSLRPFLTEKAKLDRLREDDTNGGIREKKGRFKSKIFVNN
jgi:hypothetical protein